MFGVVVPNHDAHAAYSLLNSRRFVHADRFRVRAFGKHLDESVKNKPLPQALVTVFPSWHTDGAMVSHSRGEEGFRRAWRGLRLGKTTVIPFPRDRAATPKTTSQRIERSKRTANFRAIEPQRDDQLATSPYWKT